MPLESSSRYKVFVTPFTVTLTVPGAFTVTFKTSTSPYKISTTWILIIGMALLIVRLHLAETE